MEGSSFSNYLKGIMNLEERINTWRKELHSKRFLEEGVITELEDHLRDEIDQLVSSGVNEMDAFDEAVKKLGDLSSLEQEEKKARDKSESFLLPGLMRSFLKAGARHLNKNRLTSAINLVGLTVAFVAISFIGFFIYDELSFESHHPDYERIYRLSYSFQQEEGQVEKRAFSSGMWTDILADRNPAIEEPFRFLTISYGYISNPENNQSYYEEGVYWSDPNFFDFLSFELKYGRPEDQLANLNSIVLTEKTAKKIFGAENPVGENLKYVRRGNEVNFTVTGVIYDPPSNSHFQPDYIAHYQALQGIHGEQYRGWLDQNPRPGYIYSYLKINDPSAVPFIKEDLSKWWDEVIPDRAERMEPLLTPIADIHFNPPVKWEVDIPIDMSYIYGLMIIGSFIMIVALVNFTNLTTAQGSKRQKEIGLRKTLGSTKKQLKIQFFIESSLSVLIALLIAFVISYFLMPQFNQMIGKNIDFFTVTGSAAYLNVAIPLILIILAFAGSLPALYFTRKITHSFNMNLFFKPERVNSPSRNVLVILQFIVAITLVISTAVVYNQLNLINNGHLGKSRDTVIGIRTSRMGDSVQVSRYKTRIQSISGVIEHTLGEHLPKQSDYGRVDTKWLAGDKELYWNKFEVDGGFISTYDLKLVAGQNFVRRIQPNAVIINEAALKELNLPVEEAIGTFLREDSINYVYEGESGVIIGVVEDFVYKSVKQDIEPLVIVPNNYVEGVLTVKLGEGNKQPMLTQLEEIWHEVYPGRPFEYWFLDKEFERMYSQERRLGKLIPIFSGLAIVISLLGLFALTIFISELRKKEIGIRKVLGCSTTGVVRLLGWQYLKTLIPAVIISVPLAYFGLSKWLDGFAYRVNVDVGIILFSILAVTVIAMLTISLKTITAATSNPVESLKYE